MRTAVRRTEPSNAWVFRTVAVLLFMLAVVDFVSAQAEPDPIRRARRAVHGRYIVAVRSVADPDALAGMSQGLGRGRVRHVYPERVPRVCNRGV